MDPRCGAGLEGDGRRRRGGDEIDFGERLLEVPAHERAYSLRATVVRVVVAGGERVRADHDAAFDLGAEALAAGALVEVEQINRVAATMAVADAVEAGEVRTRLGRRDDVVRRQGVLRVWQADRDADAAEVLDARQRLVEAGAHAGLDADGEILRRHADA